MSASPSSKRNLPIPMTSIERREALLHAARGLAAEGREASAKLLLGRALEEGLDLAALAAPESAQEDGFLALALPQALKRHGLAEVEARLGPVSPAAALEAAGALDAEFLLWADADLNRSAEAAQWTLAMARGLGALGETVLFSQTPIAEAHLRRALTEIPRIFTLEPHAFSPPREAPPLEQAARILAEIDDQAPRLRAVVARGVAAAEALNQDRRFQSRLIVDLDDLDASTVDDALARRLDPILRHCRLAIIPSAEMRDRLCGALGFAPPSLVAQEAAPLVERLREEAPRDQNPCGIVAFLAHDPKFVFPYYSWLKARGVPALFDPHWHWGAPQNPGGSRRILAQAQTVFCEWGLGNAVWASRNLPAGKRLVVRLHAQETRASAHRLVRQIRAEAVKLFLFVAEETRREALGLYGWEARACLHLPNFVQDQEYLLRPPRRGSRIVLGMVGIAPWSKRFDRALDLLALLIQRGLDAELRVKGRKPADLAFMQSPARRQEREDYQALVAQAAANPRLEGRLSFEPWGNDVALFAAGLDVILSPSDAESFHFALAEGALSGALPVIWSRPGAADIYAADWVVGSTAEAAAKIEAFARLSAEDQARITAAARALVVERYGRRAIYPRLNAALGLDPGFGAA